jgi:hypothetical protein
MQEILCSNTSKYSDSNAKFEVVFSEKLRKWGFAVAEILIRMDHWFKLPTSLIFIKFL